MESDTWKKSRLSYRLGGQQNYLSISLKDVTFRYPGAKDPAIKNIDLEVREGEVVGILSASLMAVRTQRLSEPSVLLQGKNNINNVPQTI